MILIYNLVKNTINGKRYNAKNLNKYLTSRSNNQYLRKVTKLIEINDIIETPLSEKLENFKLIGAIDKGKFSAISSRRI